MRTCTRSIRMYFNPRYDGRGAGGGWDTWFVRHQCKEKTRTRDAVFVINSVDGRVFEFQAPSQSRGGVCLKLTSCGGSSPPAARGLLRYQRVLTLVCHFFARRPESTGKRYDTAPLGWTSSDAWLHCFLLSLFHSFIFVYGLGVRKEHRK